MTRLPLALATVAAIMGAAGVGLAALAVHQNGGDLARTASVFLLLHAAACLGVAAHGQLAPSRALLAGGFAMAAGAILFSADLARNAFFGERLFPFAAPIGGSVTILSWAALAVAFLTATRR
jgi:uncharacterized membrane protein YgdD (TMEM256/DUF423 family)